MKLGSLFDGSGGFPLSGFLCGIEPIWASEVEPYPIAVTKSRFPHMKHLGDINKINGSEIEPVDIITFGSPCQDLSVAGKRAGLKHENNGDDETTRSGLFMEAVRIIKEMREKTNGKYPRFAVWENVPGAFSSNKGEDFKVVLEELIKIAAPNAVMPEVPRFGWAYADSYCGDGWSLAYRVLDAQYWGVPQRRRRIYLVADFGGQCAREILFKREGVRGYFTEGRTPWQEAPADAERSVGADDRTGAIPYTLKIRSGCEGGGKGSLIQKNKSATLSCNNDQYLFQPVAYSLDALSSNSMKSSNPHSGCREVNVARTIDTSTPDPSKNQGGIAIVEPAAYGVVTKGNGDAFISKERHTSLCSGGGQAGQGYPCAMQPIGADIYNLSVTGDKVCSLTAERYGSTGTSPKILEPTIALEGNGQRPSHRGDGYIVSDKSYTLNTTEIHGVVYAVDQGGGKSSVVVKDNQAPTLTCTHDGSPAVAYGVDVYNQTTTGDKAKTLTSIKSDADHVPCVSYSFDPGASRDVGVLFIEECAKTLTNGTCPGHHDGVVIANEPIAIDRAAFNQGANALYEPQINEDGTNSTLVSKGPSAVCYSVDEKCANTYIWEEQANTLAARDYKQPQAVCYQDEDEKPLGLGLQSSSGIDKMAEEASPCLINGNNPGWQIGVMTPKPTYIVRRLTPTECARLQGFADRWGDIDAKTEFSNEEYKFWLDVRNTHAAINGKQVKEYTKKQMLAWYNKLNSDGAEYKMWGNGIALPTALYVMQGIKEASNESDKD